jgi:hypothetical protein
MSRATALSVPALLGVTLALAGASALAWAQTSDPVPVRARNGVGEFQPARGSGHLGWEQNTKARPSHYDVYVKPDGGSKKKVNGKGTQGAMGGISGNLVVYQQFRGKSSNIKFYKLATGKRFSPAIYINTKRWEYWPSMSGGWVLFGRRNLSASERRVILFNRSNQSVRILDATHSTKSFIAPGQVNGNNAVWWRCRPANSCNVYRYNIQLRTTARISNPNKKNQHASSIAPDGTIYFASGGKGCGNSVKLMKRPPGGPTTSLTRVPDGLDVGDTYAIEDANGNNQVFFEEYVCNKAIGSDIYRIAG